MSIRTFLIVMVAILFIFDTEGGTISGRIGSGARVFSGRSTFGQTGSSSRKIGWNLPLTYYKGSVSRTSNGNPTSLSEFAFGTSRTNSQSRYPLTNISPYSSSGGYPWQSVRDSYHGTGNLRYLPPNINPSYPNYDDYDDTHHHHQTASLGPLLDISLP